MKQKEKCLKRKRFETGRKKDLKRKRTLESEREAFETEEIGNGQRRFETEEP